MKYLNVSLFLVISILLITGCQREETHEPVTLKVAGVDRDTFMELYGNAFLLENQDTTLEVIPNEFISDGESMEEDIASYITEHQPDVFILGTYNFRPAVETGLLLPLDTFMDTSEYEWSQYPDSLLQRLRNDSGQDQLYGLSPFYTSSALFYNKRLFDTYDVDYPRDHMSWEDVFALARKFPTQTENGERMYGFYHPDNMSIEEKLFRMIYNAGLGENLSFIDPLNGEVTLNTSSWNQLWHTFIQAYQDGIILDQPLNDLSDFSGTTPQERVKGFIEGHAAMVVAETTVFELANELEKLDVQVVQVPGTYQAQMQAGHTFAITSYSEHPDRAWEIIEFVHSEKAGLYHMVWGSLPIYSSQLEQQWGLDLSAFYNKDAALYGIYSNKGLPEGFLQRYFEAGAAEMKLIMDEGKTIEMALDDLQEVMSAAY